MPERYCWPARVRSCLLLPAKGSNNRKSSSTRILDCGIHPYGLAFLIGPSAGRVHTNEDADRVDCRRDWMFEFTPGAVAEVPGVRRSARRPGPRSNGGPNAADA